MIRNVSDITFENFENPWNFFNLFLKTDKVGINNFLRKEGILATEIKCLKCEGMCSLRVYSRVAAGECKKNRNHEFSAYKFSFFERTKLDIPDILLFIISYLDNMTLKQCATRAGIDYSNTAVQWGSYIREVMVQYHHDIIKTTEFDGDVELDESVFGRKSKYHRGATKGKCI